MYTPKYRFLSLHTSQLLLKEILRTGYKQNYDRYIKDKLNTHNITPTTFNISTQTLMQAEQVNLNLDTKNIPINNVFFRL